MDDINTLISLLSSLKKAEQRNEGPLDYEEVWGNIILREYSLSPEYATCGPGPAFLELREQAESSIDR